MIADPADDRVRAGTFDVGSLDQSIADLDYFRRSPAALGGRGDYKEWHHFCLVAPGIDFLVNFSLSDEPHTRRELARVTSLVRTNGWDGDVETFTGDRVRVAAGDIDVAFSNANRLRFEDGCFQISIALAERPIAAELRLRPVTRPRLAPNIPLPDGPPLHWVITPRSRADGTVWVDGRAHAVAGALAYHDHNWGHFLWGHSFSWIWGYCLPDDPTIPWSLVFVRLSNRERTTALAQGMFLWHGRDTARVFRDHDVRVNPGRDFLRTPEVFKVPRVMALLTPEVPTDIPSTLAMDAHAEGDSLHFAFRPLHHAQVAIPNETDLGNTTINEVTGRAGVEGSIGGRAFSFDGHAVCEFLGN
jgi:hypothetical protein